jgi:hypothetical protein
MNIEFTHIGQLVTATVILRTGQLRDTVLVIPKKIIQGISELLFYQDPDGEWRTDKEFEQEYPSTVNNIKSAIFYDC